MRRHPVLRAGWPMSTTVGCERVRSLSKASSLSRAAASRFSIRTRRSAVAFRSAPGRWQMHSGQRPQRPVRLDVHRQPALPESTRAQAVPRTAPHFRFQVAYFCRPRACSCISRISRNWRKQSIKLRILAPIWLSFSCVTSYSYAILNRTCACYA